jgi:hypothetical protein
MELTIKDITINEANGQFDHVEKLMIESTAAPLEKWVIPTQFGLINGAEDSFGLMDFWNTGECVLMAYQTNFATNYYPVDLLFLYTWLKERGWNFVIDEDLRNMAPDYWASLDQVLSEEEYVSEEVDYDDEDYDEVDEEADFLEYKRKMHEHNRPKATEYNMVEELPEFKDHKYDLEQREKREKEALF